MSNDELLEKMNERFDQQEKALQTLQKDVTAVQKNLATVQKDVTTVKQYARRTNKTLDMVARLYNQEDVSLKKRVNRLERHAGLLPME